MGIHYPRKDNHSKSSTGELNVSQTQSNRRRRRHTIVFTGHQHYSRTAQIHSSSYIHPSNLLSLAPTFNGTPGHIHHFLPAPDPNTQSDNVLVSYGTSIDQLINLTDTNLYVSYI